MRVLQIISVLCYLIPGLLSAQDISVIHLQGDAYAYSAQGDKKAYAKLSYGPITNTEKIVVKANSLVRIVRHDNQICELSKEGTYPISELKFTKVKENSIFDKFCDYFHSFFVSHSSSESKANYRNNIYAISRGNTPPPSLDFPLSGIVPSDAGSLPFIWTHACDSCEFIFTINDLKSRDIIYTIMTKNHRVEVENPAKYLKPKHIYYWSVKIPGIDLEYDNVQFSIADSSAYQSIIGSIEGDLMSSNMSMTETTKMLYIMSDLDARDKQNFALLYGLNKIKADPKNEAMSELFDRYWYDALLAK